METLGNRLKMFRQEKQMTLDDVAKAIGVSRQTIQRYESGVISNIPPEKLSKLSNLFNTTTDYLITGEKDLPELTAKDEREIESDLEDMMHSVASASCEGDDDFEDIEAFKAAVKVAMVQAKRIAKKKYTPKKYRKE